jgi:hypothetical protein
MEHGDPAKIIGTRKKFKEWQPVDGMRQVETNRHCDSDRWRSFSKAHQCDMPHPSGY